MFEGRFETPLGVKTASEKTANLGRFQALEEQKQCEPVPVKRERRSCAVLFCLFAEVLGAAYGFGVPFCLREPDYSKRRPPRCYTSLGFLPQPRQRAAFGGGRHSL